MALEKARELLRSGKCDATWAALARALNYERNTIRQSFYREFGITSPAEILGKLGGERPKRMGILQDKTTNEWEITHNGPIVYTLDGLLKACEVDLDIWFVKDRSLEIDRMLMKNLKSI